MTWQWPPVGARLFDWPPAEPSPPGGPRAEPRRCRAVSPRMPTRRQAAARMPPPPSAIPGPAGLAGRAGAREPAQLVRPSPRRAGRSCRSTRCGAAWRTRHTKRSAAPPPARRACPHAVPGTSRARRGRPPGASPPVWPAPGTRTCAARLASGPAAAAGPAIRPLPGGPVPGSAATDTGQASYRRRSVRR